MPELADTVHAIFATDRTTDNFERRFALKAYANIAGATFETYRTMLDAIANQTSEGSIQLRLELLSNLVPNVSLKEVRNTLFAYAETAEGVMGYARPLGDKLEEHPIPALFDSPLKLKRHAGGTRHYEISSLIDRLLAATIRSTPNLSANRLLAWMDNAGLDRINAPDDSIRSSIRFWLDAAPSREAELLDKLIADCTGPRYWEVPHDFFQLSARGLSNEVRSLAVARVERAADAEVNALASIALACVRPFEDHAALYWRLWDAICGRVNCDDIFAELTICSMQDWHVREAASRRQRKAERAKVTAKDRVWYKSQIEELQSGKSVHGLGYAAEVYLGYGDGDGVGIHALTDRIGDPEAIAAIAAGWQNVAFQAVDSVADVGRRSARSPIYHSDLIRVVWADQSLHAADIFDAPPSNLFAIAHYSYVLPNPRDELVRSATFDRIYSSPNAANDIVAFWMGAISGRTRELPFSRQLDPKQLSVQQAVRCLLERRPALRGRLLYDALVLAARCLGPETLLELAKKALARPLRSPTRKLWAFTAFILDPVGHVDILSVNFANPADHDQFAELIDGPLGKLTKMDGDGALLLPRIVITGLGPLHPPQQGRNYFQPTAPNCVAGAIERLAGNPTAVASLELERLIGSPELSAWTTTLQHALAKQLTVRRQAEFKPPMPGAVAAALAAGPPATPGDLRAIITESLDELASDIRHGSTSPWKGFWNRPTRRGAANTPKSENDCRDLLTDRLADRLERYGIAVKHVQTEGRSSGDRRSDIMIVLGDGAASVPIEAKRHWNRQIWTAVADQLLPYCQSAGSNGHGIYLIFWFGAVNAVPIPPDGTARPTTPVDLRKQLADRLPTELAQSISVVMIDVSDPSG